MSAAIAFIGAGRMAGAIVRGILKTGQWQPADLACTSARDGTGEALARGTGITHTENWQELLGGARWVVLACKPQQLKELPESSGALCSGKRILSILAGIPLARLREVFPGAANIVRCMPNTPGMIGRGITAYCPLHPLAPGDAADTAALLGALGECLPVDEAALDAVTGLSGSGPAYVFEFVAALRDGGIAAGLEPDTACRLAVHTVQGAAALLEAVPETPETHRDWVSSPGGTTLAGLAVMQQGRFREVIRDTVLAATRRARELAGQ